MNPDERDWIDRAVSRDGMWEPPAHFVDQVAAQAFLALPRPSPRAGLLVRLRVLLTDFSEGLALRLQGSLWVLRQYRDLLVRGI